MVTDGKTKARKKERGQEMNKESKEKRKVKEGKEEGGKVQINLFHLDYCHFNLQQMHTHTSNLQMWKSFFITITTCGHYLMTFEFVLVEDFSHSFDLRPSEPARIC